MKMTRLTAFALGMLITFSFTNVSAQPASFKRSAITKGLKKRIMGLPKVNLRDALIQRAKRKKLKYKKITLASVNALLKKRKKGARGSFKPLKLNDKIPVGSKKRSTG